MNKQEVAFEGVINKKSETNYFNGDIVIDKKFAETLPNTAGYSERAILKSFKKWKTRCRISKCYYKKIAVINLKDEKLIILTVILSGKKFAETVFEYFKIEGRRKGYC